MSFLQNLNMFNKDVSDWHTFKSLKTQTVHEVLDFSSQYGHDQSTSYTVKNIVGEPTNYPRYGDFTQALVFRTYGKWWKQCPSTRKPLKHSKTYNCFTSHDFVDIKFIDPVFPTQVEVYETYNPGAVVRILACNYADNNSNRWFVLWSGEKQHCPPKPRIFSPTLRKCPFKTRQLRLEFDQDHLEYYTELDAIFLHGLESEKEYNNGKNKEEIQEKNTVEQLTHGLQSQMVINQCHQNSSVENMDSLVHILSLPSEVINKVFSYLTYSDLGNVARTCKCFKNYCYDPLWFKEFDLQSYWTKINDSHLQLLGGRCSSVKRLNMSWCGPGELITASGFASFLQYTDQGLRCLYLSACRFLDQNTLFLIKELCPRLVELDLSSCMEIPSEAFKNLSSLTCLTWLNLYRTKIKDEELGDILRNCVKLKHINLGGCFFTTNYETCFESLKNCPDILSLDLWRTKHLTPYCLKIIADSCPNLEEIDLGWCFSSASNSETMVGYLASRCHKLKKLFLTAIRSVCDDDLITISKNCRLLEQLDILGTSQVSQASAERVLRECKNMQFFDVSFCTQLGDVWYEDAKARFPNVSLKKNVDNTLATQ